MKLVTLSMEILRGLEKVLENKPMLLVTFEVDGTKKQVFITTKVEIFMFQYLKEFHLIPYILNVVEVTNTIACKKISELGNVKYVGF